MGCSTSTPSKVIPTSDFNGPLLTHSFKYNDEIYLLSPLEPEAGTLSTQAGDEGLSMMTRETGESQSRKGDKSTLMYDLDSALKRIRMESVGIISASELYLMLQRIRQLKQNRNDLESKLLLPPSPSLCTSSSSSENQSKDVKKDAKSANLGRTMIGIDGYDVVDASALAYLFQFTRSGEEGCEDKCKEEFSDQSIQYRDATEDNIVRSIVSPLVRSRIALAGLFAPYYFIPSLNTFKVVRVQRINDVKKPNLIDVSKLCTRLLRAAVASASRFSTLVGTDHLLLYLLETNNNLKNVLLADEKYAELGISQEDFLKYKLSLLASISSNMSQDHSILQLKCIQEYETYKAMIQDLLSVKLGWKNPLSWLRAKRIACASEKLKMLKGEGIKNSSPNSDGSVSFAKAVMDMFQRTEARKAFTAGFPESNHIQRFDLMEYSSDGTLHEVISDVPNLIGTQTLTSLTASDLVEGVGISESHSAWIMRQSLMAVAQLHSLGISHGSISLDSFVLEPGIPHPQSSQAYHSQGPNQDSSDPFSYCWPSSSIERIEGSASSFDLTENAASDRIQSETGSPVQKTHGSTPVQRTPLSENDKFTAALPLHQMSSNNSSGWSSIYANGQYESRMSGSSGNSSQHMLRQIEEVLGLATSAATAAAKRGPTPTSGILHNSPAPSENNYKTPSRPNTSLGPATVNASYNAPSLSALTPAWRSTSPLIPLPLDSTQTSGKNDQRAPLQPDASPQSTNPSSVNHSPLIIPVKPRPLAVGLSSTPSGLPPLSPNSRQNRGRPGQHAKQETRPNSGAVHMALSRASPISQFSSKPPVTPNQEFLHDNENQHAGVFPTAFMATSANFPAYPSPLHRSQSAESPIEVLGYASGMGIGIETSLGRIGSSPSLGRVAIPATLVDTPEGKTNDSDVTKKPTFDCESELQDNATKFNSPQSNLQGSRAPSNGSRRSPFNTSTHGMQQNQLGLGISIDHIRPMPRTASRMNDRSVSRTGSRSKSVILALNENVDESNNRVEAEADSVAQNRKDSPLQDKLQKLGSLGPVPPPAISVLHSNQTTNQGISGTNENITSVQAKHQRFHSAYIQSVDFTPDGAHEVPDMVDRKELSVPLLSSPNQMYPKVRAPPPFMPPAASPIRGNSPSAAHNSHIPSLLTPQKPGTQNDQHEIRAGTSSTPSETQTLQHLRISSQSGSVNSLRDQILSPLAESALERVVSEMIIEKNYALSDCINLARNEFPSWNWGWGIENSKTSFIQIKFPIVRLVQPNPNLELDTEFLYDQRIDRLLNDVASLAEVCIALTTGLGSASKAKQVRLSLEDALESAKSLEFEVRRRVRADLSRELVSRADRREYMRFVAKQRLALLLQKYEAGFLGHQIASTEIMAAQAYLQQIEAETTAEADADVDLEDTTAARSLIATAAQLIVPHVRHVVRLPVPNFLRICKYAGTPIEPNYYLQSGAPELPNSLEDLCNRGAAMWLQARRARRARIVMAMGTKSLISGMNVQRPSQQYTRSLAETNMDNTNHVPVQNHLGLQKFSTRANRTPGHHHSGSYDFSTSDYALGQSKSGKTVHPSVIHLEGSGVDLQEHTEVASEDGRAMVQVHSRMRTPSPRMYSRESEFSAPLRKKQFSRGRTDLKSLALQTDSTYDAIRKPLTPHFAPVPAGSSHSIVPLVNYDLKSNGIQQTTVSNRLPPLPTLNINDYIKRSPPQNAATSQQIITQSNARQASATGMVLEDSIYSFSSLLPGVARPSPLATRSNSSSGSHSRSKSNGGDSNQQLDPIWALKACSSRRRSRSDSSGSRCDYIISPRSNGQACLQLGSQSIHSNNSDSFHTTPRDCEPLPPPATPPCPPSPSANSEGYSQSAYKPAVNTNDHLRSRKRNNDRHHDQIQISHDTPIRLLTDVTVNSVISAADNSLDGVEDSIENNVFATQMRNRRGIETQPLENDESIERDREDELAESDAYLQIEDEEVGANKAMEIAARMKQHANKLIVTAAGIPSLGARSFIESVLRLRRIKLQHEAEKDFNVEYPSEFGEYQDSFCSEIIQSTQNSNAFVHALSKHPWLEQDFDPLLPTPNAAKKYLQSAFAAINAFKESLESATDERIHTNKTVFKKKSRSRCLIHESDHDISLNCALESGSTQSPTGNIELDDENTGSTSSCAHNWSCGTDSTVRNHDENSLSAIKIQRKRLSSRRLHFKRKTSPKCGIERTFLTGAQSSLPALPESFTLANASVDCEGLSPTEKGNTSSENIDTDHERYTRNSPEFVHSETSMSLGTKNENQPIVSHVEVRQSSSFLRPSSPSRSASQDSQLIQRTIDRGNSQFIVKKRKLGPPKNYLSMKNKMARGNLSKAFSGWQKIKCTCAVQKELSNAQAAHKQGKQHQKSLLSSRSYPFSFSRILVRRFFTRLTKPHRVLIFILMRSKRIHQLAAILWHKFSYGFSKAAISSRVAHIRQGYAQHLSEAFESNWSVQDNTQSQEMDSSLEAVPCVSLLLPAAFLPNESVPLPIRCPVANLHPSSQWPFDRLRMSAATLLLQVRDPQDLLVPQILTLWKFADVQNRLRKVNQATLESRQLACECEQSCFPGCALADLGHRYIKCDHSWHTDRMPSKCASIAESSVITGGVLPSANEETDSVFASSTLPSAPIPLEFVCPESLSPLKASEFSALSKSVVGRSNAENSSSENDEYVRDLANEDLIRVVISFLRTVQSGDLLTSKLRKRIKNSECGYSSNTPATERDVQPGLDKVSTNHSIEPNSTAVELRIQNQKSDSALLKNMLARKARNVLKKAQIRDKSRETAFVKILESDSVQLSQWKCSSSLTNKSLDSNTTNAQLSNGEGFQSNSSGARSNETQVDQSLPLISSEKINRPASADGIKRRKKRFAKEKTKPLRSPSAHRRVDFRTRNNVIKGHVSEAISRPALDNKARQYNLSPYPSDVSVAGTQDSSARLTKRELAHQSSGKKGGKCREAFLAKEPLITFRSLVFLLAIGAVGPASLLSQAPASWVLAKDMYDSVFGCSQDEWKSSTPLGKRSLGKVLRLFAENGLSEQEWRELSPTLTLGGSCKQLQTDAKYDTSAGQSPASINTLAELRWSRESLAGLIQGRCLPPLSQTSAEFAAESLIRSVKHLSRNRNDRGSSERHLGSESSPSSDSSVDSETSFTTSSVATASPSSLNASVESTNEICRRSFFGGGNVKSKHNPQHNYPEYGIKMKPHVIPKLVASKQVAPDVNWEDWINLLGLKLQDDLFTLQKLSTQNSI